ncbi:MAG TPA: pyruvate, phosphate dikinase, partial [Treponema sp.]|nr:pyruvate, phosphate dikinase [Treponema sp.]
MDNRIHFFSSIDVIPKKVDGELLGIRGRQANEFAELGFPILPGFIINTQLASQLDKVDIKKDVKTLLDKCASIVGKRFGDPENPMLLKIVVSTNLAVSNYPTLHNFGLVRSVIPGFAKWVGDNFAAHEVLFMVRGILKIEDQIASIQEDKEKISLYKDLLSKLAKEIDSDHPAKSALEYMDFYAPYVPVEFFDSAEGQLMITLRELSKLLALDSQNDNDTALMIQPMVYGNYGKDSCSGAFFSRNIVTGEKKLQGEFYR